MYLAITTIVEANKILFNLIPYNFKNNLITGLNALEQMYFCENLFPL